MTFVILNPRFSSRGMQFLDEGAAELDGDRTRYGCSVMGDNQCRVGALVRLDWSERPRRKHAANMQLLLIFAAPPYRFEFR